MTEDKIRLPGSSYDEINKIIKGYGFFKNKPITLDEAAKVCKMDKTAISRNNGFLTSVGIIEGDKSKAITKIGLDLSMAMQHERNDEIAKLWREIINSNDFLSKMLAAVRIRKGMDISTLQSHIAYSAGQPKNRNIMSGAKAIIDILISAELLKEKDGQLIAQDVIEKSSISTSKNEMGNNQGIESLGSDSSTITSTIPSEGRAITFNLNIDIRIDAKPEELEGLGVKLRKVVEDFSKSIDSEI